MNNTELKNLVTLFDDPDTEVRDMINYRLLSEGKGITSLLLNLYDSEEEQEVKVEILKRVEFLEREFALADLKKNLSVDYVDFFESLYLINKIAEPRLAGEVYRDRMNYYIQQFAKEINGYQTALEKIGIFNEIFYKRNSFQVTDFFYTELRRSHIAEIIKSHEGSPISIAVLYMLFALEVGLPIVPLCFHSGFVFCYIENDDILFYINAFREGEIFYESNLRVFIEDYGIEYKREEFSLRDPKVLLSMYVEVYHYIYMLSRNVAMMEIMEKILEMFGSERFMVMEEDDEDM